MLSGISASEVDRFLEGTEFSGYQSVPLPRGRKVPGKDRARTADLVFRHGVEGKSVLDVGTYYGFFPFEAMRRGADHALGIEMDRGRYEIASRIADLNGRRYEIANVSLEEFEVTRRFDVVLALNVLHHVLDPVAFVSHLAELCSGTVVIEFRLPEDPGYIESVRGDGASPRLGQRVAARGRSSLLRIAGAGLPLMAVGSREYHRVFYFSKDAFRNLFVIHLKRFQHVDFVDSPGTGRRAIAFCRVVD